MHELPNIAKTGKLIEQSNPQTELRRNAELAYDWEYPKKTANLYRIAVFFGNF